MKRSRCGGLERQPKRHKSAKDLDDETKAFQSEYRAVHTLSEVLRLRSLAHRPLFLSRTLNFIQRHRTKLNKKRGWERTTCNFHVDELLGLLSTKYLGTRCLQNCAAKYLTVCLDSLQLSKSQMPQSVDPHCRRSSAATVERCLCVRGKLWHDDKVVSAASSFVTVHTTKEEYTWHLENDKTHLAGFIFSSGSDELFRFDTNWFRHQLPTRSAAYLAGWKVVLHFTQLGKRSMMLKTPGVPRSELEESSNGAYLTASVSLNRLQKFLEGGSFELDICNPYKGKRGGKMKIRLVWVYDTNAPSEMPLSLPEKTSDLSTCVRFKYYYRYNNNSSYRLEPHDDFKCPWCQLDCGDAQGLVLHLECSHFYFKFRFTFKNTAKKRIPEIRVSLDKASSLVVPQFVDFSEEKFNPPSLPLKTACDALPHVNFHFCRKVGSNGAGCSKEVTVENDMHTSNEPSLVELSSKEDKRRRSLRLLHPITDLALQNAEHFMGQRFFHASSMTPIFPHEFENPDSDLEVDDTWSVERSRRKLDEFEDVTWGEKQLFKLWNDYKHDRRIVSDAALPEFCVQFVRDKGGELLHNNLRQLFLLMLVDFWQRGLLEKHHMTTVMNALDTAGAENKESS